VGLRICDDRRYYRLTHAAPWNLYAAPSEAEAVTGYILNGKGGYFEVDIPLYSSRPFVHRGVMPGPSAGVQVVEWNPDRIVLNIGPDFASGVLECVARRRGSMLAFGQDGKHVGVGQEVQLGTLRR
jgi:hypothetical protein